MGPLFAWLLLGFRTGGTWGDGERRGGKDCRGSYSRAGERAFNSFSCPVFPFLIFFIGGFFTAAICFRWRGSGREAPFSRLEQIRQMFLFRGNGGAAGHCSLILKWQRGKSNFSGSSGSSSRSLAVIS